MNTLKPLRDQILIEPSEAADTTEGGLYIPEKAKPKPTTGKVVAVGPGRLNDKGGRHPMEVEPGDVVMFNKHAGTDVDGLTLLRESDVLGVLVEGP